MSRTIVGTLFSGTVVPLLIACAPLTLAPDYTQAIVDGLTSENPRLMTFFASASSGTAKETFDTREETYNGFIGNFDALAIQAKTRPVPENDRITQKVNEYLNKRGIHIEGGEVPSATAMEKISATLAKMRDTDRKQGVTPFEVAAFRGQVLIYLDQAMTYENFLKR